MYSEKKKEIFKLNYYVKVKEKLHKDLPANKLRASYTKKNCQLLFTRMV
jgi:hypothetical protein